jgi:two-component system, chemotaxis family, protein-glutamate methylesterase/glutaminase
MQFHPLPAVVISSLAQKNCSAALDAMAFGAVEVLAKPAGPHSVGELGVTLAEKIRAAALTKRSNMEETPQSKPIAAGAFTPETVIAIGASTGGTEAIAAIMKSVPADAPPIVIAQHMPPVFSRAFAERLHASCAIEVKEAADGDELRPGRALVAPGDYHMLLRKRAGSYRVEVRTGPRVCYQRPSVDVLFFSVAEAAGAHATGALLTGMGADGAEGLLKMRQAGARTIAQDEATCAIFGMPREAIKRAAVQRVLPLNLIAGEMLRERERLAERRTA